MKTILVTGAGAGIGLAATRLLCQSGHQVWGTSRTPDRLPSLPGLRRVALDLGDPGSVDRAAATVLAEAGVPDVLVNNAGSGRFGLLCDFDPDSLRREFEILVQGPARLVNLLLPGMLARGLGTVINVTSLAARFPIPGLGPYSAAKAALASLTRNWRIECAGTGVRFLDLQPGDIDTPFRQSMTSVYADADAMPEQAGRIYRELDKSFRRAPGVEFAAQALVRMLESDSDASPRAVGDFFHSRLAPLGQRWLPASWIESAIRRIYRA